MTALTNLWPRVRDLVAAAEHPSRYVNHEWGSVHGNPDDFHFCLIYPDTYELGQANQALRILVNAVNACEGFSAERGFLPGADMCDALRAHGLPLFSIESCAPLREFDCVGITLPHELAATNVLEALDLAGIPLRAADRDEDCPLVVGGGPCALNPEPYAPFFDAMNIGEGEEMVPEGLRVIRDCRAAGVPRAETLRRLAQVPGWYIPGLYRWRTDAQAQEAGSWIEPLEPGLPAVIEKRIFEGFAQSNAWEPCIVPYSEVIQDRLNVEILRGCARGCRFCQAGMMYRPVRERAAANIVDAVKHGLAVTGYNEVSLTSLSSTDHSQIREILSDLNKATENTGVKVSIPSQRLDSFGAQMAALVAGSKKSSLTFAPEAGTQRLRDVINKNVSEEDLFAAIDAAFSLGWRTCKLYFMIGLPTETDDDIKGIARLAQQASDRAKAAIEKIDPAQRGAVQINVSCALFVPKAQTPFQWDGQITPEEAMRRVNLLRHSVKYKNVRVSWHDPATSFVEAFMSRSGREAADVIEGAWKRGARFDAWTELFREDAWQGAIDACGVDVAAVAQTSYPTSRVMPWEHISMGASRRWLVRERDRAEAGVTTPDCTFANCSACGVCMGLGVDNQLPAPRVPTGDAAGAGAADGAAGAASDGEVQHG